MLNRTELSTSSRRPRVPAHTLSGVARNPQWTRAGLVVTLAVLSGVAAHHAQALHEHPTDFAQVWHGARAFLAGDDPYAVVGPGRAFEWPFPLLYPLTAIIAAIPFALMPLPVANVLFAAVGAGALAWTITADADRRPLWWAFASWSYFEVLHIAQWSPVLMAATLAPSAGLLLACKPTLGLALFAGYPSSRAAFGAAAFGAVSLVVDPSWPWRWGSTLDAATHMSAPLAHVHFGGPLLLLALLRWRRPEARVLLGMACVPHTTLVYEALPLFLVVRRWYEGGFLAATGMVIAYMRIDRTDYDAWVWNTGNWITLLMYVPCLLMVLRRPNIGALHTANPTTPVDSVASALARVRESMRWLRAS